MYYVCGDGEVCKVIDRKTGEVLLTIERAPDAEGLPHQVIITTAKERYAGPVEFLTFGPWPDK